MSSDGACGGFDLLCTPEALAVRVKGESEAARQVKIIALIIKGPWFRSMWIFFHIKGESRLCA